MTACRLPVLIAALIATSSVLAASDNNATIDNSGAGYHGNVTLNQAAGDQQQQVNVRAVAIGTAAKASTAVSQKSPRRPTPRSMPGPRLAATLSVTAAARLVSTSPPGPTIKWSMQYGSASVPSRKASTTAPCPNRTWRYQTRVPHSPPAAVARSSTAIRPSPAAEGWCS